MVLTTRSLLARVSKHTNPFFGRETPSYDNYWRKRSVLMQTAHFSGRLRNCYALAWKYNLRALTYVSLGRSYRKKDTRDLWDTRIEGACQELDYNAWHMRDGLTRSGVYLDRKVLANLAFTEPRTFRAVTQIAATKSMEPVEEGGLGLQPCGPNIKTYDNL